MVNFDEPNRNQLETFPNPSPGRDYIIEIKTGHPDFGTMTFTYTPSDVCVELKSLKLYLQRFRNVGSFYEAVTNRILEDFVAVSKPIRCKLSGVFTPRGGISTNITCTYPFNHQHK